MIRINRNKWKEIRFGLTMMKCRMATLMELVREDQMSHKTNIRGRECGTDGIDEEKTRRNMCARQTAVWGCSTVYQGHDGWCCVDCGGILRLCLRAYSEVLQSCSAAVELPKLDRQNLNTKDLVFPFISISLSFFTYLSNVCPISFKVLST